MIGLIIPNGVMHKLLACAMLDVDSCLVRNDDNGCKSLKFKQQQKFTHIPKFVPQFNHEKHFVS